MAMQFVIKETGERKTLSIIDQATGCDWVQDLIGNSGAIGDYIHYDDEAEAYRISQDDYDWWADYIDKAQVDHDEAASLREDYDGDLVDAAINAEFDGINDYDDHHAAYQRAFATIRQS